MTRYLAFDLETTGTAPETDRVIEFCFIELDEQLQEKARWTDLVHPGGPIPEASVRIHGITDAMVADAAPFSKHAARIQNIVQNTVLIGHNVRFDVQFLHHELQRAQLPGLRVDHPTIDTSYLEAIVHPRNLAALYEKYTGNALDDAHRSTADTAATVEVLRGQLREHGGKALPADLPSMETRVLRRARDPENARTWLDHGHRFYEDAEGTIRFGFGKHRDQPAASQPDYLAWMRRQSFPPEVVTIIDEVLYRVTEPDAPPAGQRTLGA